MDSPPTLLLGASVRALARSFQRAGLKCRGADLFADEDTRQLACVDLVADYPAGFADIAEKFPPSDWMYTGGLENYPLLIDQFSRRHRLRGNPGDIVARVRDPLELHRQLQAAGLPTPATVLSSPSAGGCQTWMRKPRQSCGGMHVQLAHEADYDKSDEVYFQEYIEGTPVAALFVGLSDAARLLGATRQIIGHPWTGGKRFQYAGSIGPVALPNDIQSQVQQLGELLAGKFGLRGLYGVDGILNAEGFWTIEVNPRYTASVEILERASGEPAILRHLEACTGEKREAPRPRPTGTSMSCHGKAIVFSDSNARVAGDFANLVSQLEQDGDDSAIADIPRQGSVVGTGKPVCTVFASATSESQVTEQLKNRALQVRSSLARES